MYLRYTEWKILLIETAFSVSFYLCAHVFANEMSVRWCRLTGLLLEIEKKSIYIKQRRKENIRMI